MSKKQLERETKVRQSPGDYFFHGVNILVFAIITLICIFPFYYLIINTISNNELSSNGDIIFLPRGIHFQNYFQILKLQGLSAAAWISVARTALGTTLTVVVSAFLGFMFTQERMWGRKFWYRYMVVTMYFNAGLIPLYMTMKLLNLVDSFWVYIIPLIVQPFFIILVKTYLESLPASLQEAAEIDGAGTMTIFLKIIFPLSMPILATIAVFSAVSQWNSFQDTLIYITDQKLYSLQYVLYQYINQANSLMQLLKNSTTISSAAMVNLATQQTPTSVRMTVSVIVVLPILVIYPFFQRFFTKGIMIGAVKG